MNPAPDVRSRLHRAADAIEVATDEALTMVDGAVERRHHRRKIGAIAVAVAIVGALGFTGWRADFREGSSVPLGDPSPTTTSVETGIEITPPPPGVEPKLTYEEIERYVFAQIAKDEEELGTRLAEPRIISITYVEAGEKFGSYQFREPLAYPTWVVEYDGTALVCSSWCSGHPGARLQIADANDPDKFGGSWHMQDLVCVDRHTEALTEAAPESTDDSPSC